jgi:hypothetical protein
MNITIAMAESKIAKLYLCICETSSRIEITYYQSFKSIKVYISNVGIRGQIVTYPLRLLQDFINAVKGCQVPEIIANKEHIHPTVIQIFLSICQNANNAPADDIEVDTNTNIYHTTLTPHVRPMPEPNNERPLFNNAFGNLFTLPLTNNVPHPPHRQNNLQNEYPTHRQNNLQPNAMYIPERTPSPRRPIDNQQQRESTHTSENLLSTLNMMRSNLLNNVPANTPSIVNPIEQLTRPNQLHTRFVNDLLQNMRNRREFNLSDSSPYIDNENTENTENTENENNTEYNTEDNEEETEPPQRFTVNDRTEREILEHSDYTAGEAIDAEHTSPTNLETKEQHPILSSQPHATSLSIERRLPVTPNIIATMVLTIDSILRTTNTRPPNFNSRTRSGYRKIKNFIHNITKIWLSHTEINLFTTELNRLIRSRNALQSNTSETVE